MPAAIAETGETVAAHRFTFPAARTDPALLLAVILSGGGRHYRVRLVVVLRLSGDFPLDAVKRFPLSLL